MSSSHKVPYILFKKCCKFCINIHFVVLLSVLLSLNSLFVNQLSMDQLQSVAGKIIVLHVVIIFHFLLAIK